MPNEELKKRFEEYKNRIINEQIEKFYKISPEERIEYINDLIEVNKEYPFFNINLRNGYGRWFFILRSMSIKTIEINQLKEFYQSLDDKGKKEFQTELYETIESWGWDCNVDDCDKVLEPFYNFDKINSRLEEVKKKIFTEFKQDSHDYHEKLLNTFVERCSGKVIEDFEKSFDDYAILMEENLSNSTKKKLFSLPAHKRVYIFMEMYRTARFWNFEDSYLTSRYDSRQEIRKEKKQQLKSKEDIISNSKGYVKKKYPLIRPRV